MKEDVRSAWHLNDVILGGGLAGLVTNYIFPEATIISKDTGGMIKRKPFLFKLHEEAGVKHFLCDLGIPHNEKICHIGYYYKKGFHKDCPERLRKEYYEKTRMKEYGKTHFGKFMTQGKRWFPYYEVDKFTLVQQLISKANIRQGEVTYINTNKDFLDLSDGTRVHYKRLFVTIPAIEFCQLVHHMLPLCPDFEYTKKVTQQTDYDNYQIQDTEYDYVYFPEKEIPVIRITKEKDAYDNYFFINEFKPDVIVCDSFHVFPYGNLISAPDFKKYVPRNVHFVGRYANWDQKILISNVIYLLMLYKSGGIL
jgi:hypothetical protein